MSRSDHPVFVHFLLRLQEEADRFVKERLDRIGLDIGRTHLEILLYLARKGESAMQPLARAIHRDKSTLTALVQRLEKEQLIERGESEDRRIRPIRLTPKAQKLRPALLRILPDLHRHLSRSLSRQERETLRRLLRGIFLSVVDAERSPNIIYEKPGRDAP